MDGDSLQDGVLIARAIAGEEDAFSFLVRRHQGSLLAVARHLLRDPEEAREAAQEAFLKAWRNIRGFSGRGSFRGWLLTILRRCCIDRIRSAGQNESNPGAWPPEGMERDSASTREHPGEKRIVTAERRIALEAALGILTSRQRLALMLSAGEECSASEIAAALGCATATARVTLFKARRKALKALEQYMKERGVEQGKVRDALLGT